MTDISEVEAVPDQASLEGLEQARERQLEAIRSQYSQRISILEKERDSRLQGVERSFQQQIDSMKAAMARSKESTDVTKH
jgi:hypothetical protein